MSTYISAHLSEAQNDMIWWKSNQQSQKQNTSLMILWKLHCWSLVQRQKNITNHNACFRNLQLAGSSACVWLQQSRFHWIISDGVVNGIRRNGNVLILLPPILSSYEVVFTVKWKIMLLGLFNSVIGLVHRKRWVSLAWWCWILGCLPLVRTGPPEGTGSCCLKWPLCAIHAWVLRGQHEMLNAKQYGGSWANLQHRMSACSYRFSLPRRRGISFRRKPWGYFVVLSSCCVFTWRKWARIMQYFEFWQHFLPITSQLLWFDPVCSKTAVHLQEGSTNPHMHTTLSVKQLRI